MDRSVENSDIEVLKNLILPKKSSSIILIQNYQKFLAVLIALTAPVDKECNPTIITNYAQKISW
jgi:hypothetical protein